MDSTSHTALSLVNPDDITTERENITYEHMRKKKLVLGYIFWHTNGHNLSFLSQQSCLVISLSMLFPLVRSLYVNHRVVLLYDVNIIRDCRECGWKQKNKNAIKHSDYHCPLITKIKIW